MVSILPKISILIATYNSDRTLKQCLESVSNQDYPNSLIQLIIADGGSTDTTLQITKQFGAEIITVPKDKQSAEYNKGYGAQYATSEFILFIDHDNILPHASWLTKMIQPHLQNSDLVAVEPLRYAYRKEHSLLDRYFALFGVNDPVPFYLHKADRLSYIYDDYNLLGSSHQENGYVIVTFDQKNPERIPTLGANGFLIRKRFFDVADKSPEHYFHIDINVDIIKKGHTKYAFINDEIIHLTNNKLFNFLKRRKYFVDHYYVKESRNRRYSVYMKEDFWSLILYIIFTLTLVRPLWDSIRGWYKIRDIAWFIHPFMCFAFLYIYSSSILHNWLEMDNKHN